MDRNAVLRQTEDLLGHSAFRKSVRCTKLLRYLVDKSLDDPDFVPKERTLAIEVFGRRPDYDTATDPIVRTTANEIRKRLGSYFHDVGPAAEVLIELPSGSYRPVFRPAVASPVATSSPRVSRPYLLAACIAGAALILVAGAVMLSRHVPESNADRFWHPFLFPPRKILVCPPNSDVATGRSMISVSDSKAVWRVLSVLVKVEDNVSVRASDRIQASDLREHPTVIIGGLDNPWSAVVTAHLRFQLIAEDSNQTVRIVDEQSPSDRRWAVDAGDLSKNQSRSYALISRIIDPTTHNPVLNIAGVGLYATAAAGEFLAQPEYLNSLGRALDSCGSHLQLVLSAEATNGVVSKRKVEALHCW